MIPSWNKFKSQGMKDYLFKKNLTVKKFAADLDISTSYLYQLLRGERRPSLELAHKIEKYTKGEVTVKKLLEEALHKKSFSYNEVDIQQELANYQKRLQALEESGDYIKKQFDMIEERLTKLEKERDR